MLLNCGVGEDSLESLGLQGDQLSPSQRKPVLNIHWKDWYWIWNSNSLATWCKQLTHWKRPWCWERLKAGQEGDDRGWDGWMTSLTQWPWILASFGSWWWTGKPGVLQSMGWQRVRHGWVTELNWYSLWICLNWPSLFRESCFLSIVINSGNPGLIHFAPPQTSVRFSGNSMTFVLSFLLVASFCSVWIWNGVIVLRDPTRFPNRKQYPLRREAREGLQALINKFLACGLLVPTNLPWNTPILSVKKKDVTWRVVQDLWIINEAVVPLHPTAPNPYVILGEIPPSAKCFTVLGLKDAFFFLHITG